MHGFPKYANVSFWPKADIRTESKSPFLNVRFGEKKRTFSPESEWRNQDKTGSLGLDRESLTRRWRVLKGGWLFDPDKLRHRHPPAPLNNYGELA